MGFDRRTFLQQAGLAWFTWGAAEAGITAWGNNNHLAALVKNYQQTLATPTNRKLALLVGINRYPHNDKLDGCLTDIELQRELLIHRFGFQPQDILSLSDRQATRENIETAFIEHLGQQAQADDVVVFHFSGYGGQIKMPLTSEIGTDKNLNNEEAFRLVNSFVPVDGVVPAKKTLIANSILQETLLVLAQSLSTTKCTFILDTSFNTTPRSRHSSLKIRSIAEIADSPSSQELAFLAELETDLAAKGLKPSKRLLSLPGIVLSASGNNQVAAERHWHGFSAGLFSQALTQHLWQITPSSKVQTVLVKTAATVEQVMGKQQQPTLNNPDKSTIAYYLATSDAPNGIGVISKINSNGNIEIKLLGLPANILDCYGVHSCLSLIASNNLQLQIKSKEGLVSKAQLLSPATENIPQVGQLVQEKIRILEPNLRLTLALDPDLQRIERVDATSAIANIAAVNLAIVSGEQNADCLLGKVHHESSPDAAKSDTNSEVKTFSYGLYTQGGMLIGQTTGLEEEAVKIAIERLKPQFNNLLAAKWLGLTSNEFSSRLKVNADLTTGEKKSAINLQAATFISEQSSPTKKSAFSNNSYNLNLGSAIPILIQGSEIQLTLSNTDAQELYVILLGVDSDSEIFALYTPTQPTTVETEAKLKNIAIAPQNELVIPQTDSSWKWKVSDTVGINTLYAIFAVKPFEQTLKALATQQNIKLDQQQVLNVVNPQVVLQAVMQDLHAASSVSSELLPSSDVYALDVNCWATLSFVYEVVNA
ncbi:MAG: caspase family protein [Waterburya sp.]